MKYQVGHNFWYHRQETTCCQWGGCNGTATLTGKILAILVAFFLTSCGASLKSGPTPIPKTAHYMVDTSRTMNMVQSGTFDVTVIGKSDVDDSYDVKVGYSLRVFLMGNKVGSQIEAIPQTYWDDSWWTVLRKTGHQTTPRFKADHLGYENTITMNGQHYDGCDKVRLYDIDTTGTEASDVVVVAYIVRNTIPVIGAAKFDVSGRMSGSKFYLGADYTNETR